MNILKYERSVIERTVSEKLNGVYCLGNFVDKKFFVRFIGRSDTKFRRFCNTKSQKNSLHFILFTLIPYLKLLELLTVMPLKKLKLDSMGGI